MKKYYRNDLKGMLPEIDRGIHKGDRGGVLVVGGSSNYRGAPLLAALGALRAGAGLVVLAVPDFMADSASLLLPEAIFAPLTTTAAGEIAAEHVEDAISPWVNRCGAAVFGPGIGRHSGNGELLRLFWDKWKAPLLLDADALFFYAQMKNSLKHRDNAVITPHVGEASRILGVAAREINDAREVSCRMLSSVAEVAVLKGQRTLISSHSLTRMVCEGSPALAVPGSGDVLSGVTGAFLASGMEPLDAATAAVLAHACAGNELEKKYGLRGSLAREIANEIPYILR